MRVDVNIRPFLPEDAHEIGALFRHTIMHSTANHYSLEQRNAWRGHKTSADMWVDKLSKMNTVVADDGGAVVGFMALEESSHIAYAYVAHTHIGTGVADALYRPLLQAAQFQERDKMTTDASHLAKSFFLRHGWHVVYAQTVMRNDVELENFHMELVF